MTFIDWSDPEGMFGLLVDFVADETADCQGDPRRRRFLEELLEQLRALGVELQEIQGSEAIQRLKDIHAAVDREFLRDPVMAHLQDCVEELERVWGEGG